MTDFGLYVHAPFCKSKCRYCDFYSSLADGTVIDSYTKRVTEEIKRWGVRAARPIDTLYLGGGTPTLLGGDNIGRIILAADDAFSIKSKAEITLECNPGDDLRETLKQAFSFGVNRLSVGVQSGNDKILKMLGRRHTAAQAEKTVALAREIGFKNISLDLMIGLPESDCSSVRESIDFVCSLSPEHISVYMLKIEQNTPFYKSPPLLPDDDAVAEQYLFACEYLESMGYEQYEISNFCKKGFYSRHNKNYWLGGEYLGIGPSAHSYFSGRRFYYPRDMAAFMSGTPIVPDGKGGGADEFIMLRLRLKEGILWEELKSFDIDIQKMKTTAKQLQKAGLLQIDNKGIRLTREGFLLSNAVIGELL